MLNGQFLPKSKRLYLETKFNSCKVLVNIQPTVTRYWGGGGGEEVANENHENLISISYVTPDVCFFEMCLRSPLVPRFTKQPKPNRKKHTSVSKSGFQDTGQQVTKSSDH